MHNLVAKANVKFPRSTWCALNTLISKGCWNEAWIVLLTCPPTNELFMALIVLLQPLFQGPEVVSHGGGVYLPLARQRLQRLWPRPRLPQLHHRPVESMHLLPKEYKVMVVLHALMRHFRIPNQAHVVLALWPLFECSPKLSITKRA